MKVAQFSGGRGESIGIELDGSWIDFTKAQTAHTWLTRRVQETPVSHLGNWIQSGTFDVRTIKTVLDFVREQKLTTVFRLDPKAEMKAPIARPLKIVALGLNYALHAAEGNFKVPDEPIIFMKAGSSVVGPGETVRIPKGLGRMDHEVELAVVIGRKATGVKKKNAFEYIAGYTIANDVSARDLQTKDLEKKHPWFRSKSFDSFTPLGPWIVTGDEIKPPLHLDIECLVNGKIRQKANTRDMVFDIATQIEFISKYITLEPGDIVSTGTPDGIGPIKHGDEMMCRIERIGELKNPVRNR